MSFIENAKENLQNLFIVAVVGALIALDFLFISWAISTNNWLWYVSATIVLGLILIIVMRKV